VQAREILRSLSYEVCSSKVFDWRHISRLLQAIVDNATIPTDKAFIITQISQYDKPPL